MSVSIIIPLLNEALAIHSLVAHLLALSQRHNGSDLEIILVDGGSQDETLSALSESAFRVISCEPGRATQMNAGAAIANNNALLFLHADTRLPTDFMSEIQRAKVWGRFDVSFDAPSIAMRIIAAFMNARSRFTGVATGDQALFINADVFTAIGGFPRIPLMEDVAICKILKRLHAPFCSRSKVLTSARRWQEYGVVTTVLKMWWYRLAFFLGVSPRWLARNYYDAR